MSIRNGPIIHTQDVHVPRPRRKENLVKVGEAAAAAAVSAPQRILRQATRTYGFTHAVHATHGSFTQFAHYTCVREMTSSVGLLTARHAFGRFRSGSPSMVALSLDMQWSAGAMRCRTFEGHSASPNRRKHIIIGDMCGNDAVEGELAGPSDCWEERGKHCRLTKFCGEGVWQLISISCHTILFALKLLSSA